MQIKLPAPVLTAINLLNHAGYEAFVVGGSIRNALLHLPIYDYDMTTSATPNEMKEVFKDYKIIETGIKHGTLTIHIDHFALEITTYRIESEYLDHRHPSAVSFSRNLKDDLERRDFTINAFAYHPTLGIVDYFNGHEDLNNHIIRAINNPLIRFDEDALRIMRAIRFSSTLNFTIESNTAKAIHDSKDLLLSISKERIHDELIKLIVGDNVYQILIEYQDILELIIPELLTINDYSSNVSILANSIKDINIRIAILLHSLDINLAKDVLKQLKFSNKDSKAILTLIANYHNQLTTNRIELKKILFKLDKELTYQLLDLQYADSSNNITSEVYHSIKDILDDIITKQECFTIKALAINGNDVISLGINPTNITTILNACLKEVIEERIDNTKNNLLEYITHNFN